MSMANAVLPTLYACRYIYASVFRYATFLWSIILKTETSKFTADGILILLLGTMYFNYSSYRISLLFF